MMKRLALIAALTAAGISEVSADPWLSSVPLGYQQITSLSSAANLTVPSGATRAVIVCHTAAVRYRDDGTAPTSTVGMPLAVDQPFTYTGTLSVIKFIAQTGSPELDISYYR